MARAATSRSNTLNSWGITWKPYSLLCKRIYIRIPLVHTVSVPGGFHAILRDPALPPPHRHNERWLYPHRAGEEEHVQPLGADPIILARYGNRRVQGMQERQMRSDLKFGRYLSSRKIGSEPCRAQSSKARTAAFLFSPITTRPKNHRLNFLQISSGRGPPWQAA